ncbi:MAG: class I SAM-dependent methyltransferase [Woeseia sp.]
MFEAADTLASYWEKRAVKFARHEDGLAAVCSYGMPRFYNRSIEICQQRALRPWLEDLSDTDVLEIGCGVGRWTEMLSRQGNRVTAIDLSPTMVSESSRRLKANALSADLQTADISEFSSGKQFDAAVSVTVLQHIMDDERFDQAFRNIADQMRPGGRFVLLEAAPSDNDVRCNSPIFRARPFSAYQAVLERNGFRIETVAGVDPMPFKTWVLPYLRSMPRPLAVATIAVATALSLPLDLALASRMPKQSWHKLIVAVREERA